MVKFVRVCPHCLSKSFEPAGMSMAGDVSNMRCLRCGRTFPPFMAIEVDESLAK